MAGRGRGKERTYGLQGAEVRRDMLAGDGLNPKPCTMPRLLRGVHVVDNEAHSRRWGRQTNCASLAKPVRILLREKPTARTCW